FLFDLAASGGFDGQCLDLLVCHRVINCWLFVERHGPNLSLHLPDADFGLDVTRCFSISSLCELARVRSRSTVAVGDVATARTKGEGEIKGTMAFDRKEFGMNSGIPFHPRKSAGHWPESF